MSAPGAESGSAAPRPRIEGGGSIAVDTDELARAGHLLAVTGEDLGDLRRRTAVCRARATTPVLVARLAEAETVLARAVDEAEAAADQVRTAALRYGRAEAAATDAQRIAWATGAATTGAVARLALALIGPAGPLLVVEAAGTAGAVATLAEMLRQWSTTGLLQPQLDPVLIRRLQLTLSSIDDAGRAFLGVERPEDLLADDPGSFLGSATVAAFLAPLAGPRAGGPLLVRPTTRRAVVPPKDLTELVERVPQGEEPAGQVTIERYDGEGGTRWIVYSSGTVTFAPDSGKEPFDDGSNLDGVAGLPTDAQRSILLAMREAGIGADEPVLFVGYSQGALNAVRVAQDGGYAVGGVVEYGGPTGQIVLPESVPVIAFEHDQDVVPRLGGLAATGAAGARRLVVRRDLVLGGASPSAPPFTAGFAAHDRAAYAETVREAEADADPALVAQRGRMSGFFTGGDGVATRYHAERAAPARPGPVLEGLLRSAGGHPAPPPVGRPPESIVPPPGRPLESVVPGPPALR